MRREVPSLRGDRGKSAYIGQNHFTCLLTLALSDGSAATLAKAKRLTHFYSVAPLLEKWFACFPLSGDGLRNGGFCFYDGQDVFFVCVISLFFIFPHIKTAFLIDGFPLSVLFLRIPAVILPGERCFLCFPRNN